MATGTRPEPMGFLHGVPAHEAAQGLSPLGSTGGVPGPLVAGCGVLAAYLLLRRPVARCCGHRQPKAGPVMPDSPTQRSRSTVMQVPTAPCTVALAKQQHRRAPDKLLEAESDVWQQALVPGSRPGGPTLLRYRGPPPHHSSGIGAGAPTSPGEGMREAELSGLETVPSAALPAYQHGAKVEVYSAAERRWLQGTVAVIPEVSEGGPPTLYYEVTAGRRKQLHRHVALERLREPLLEGEALELLTSCPGAAGPQRWLPAVMLSGSGPRCCRVLPLGPGVEGRGAAGAEQAEVLEGVRPERLRRRFPPGAAVEVYRGAACGWLAGTVEPQALQPSGCTTRGAGGAESAQADVLVRFDSACPCADMGTPQLRRQGPQLVPAHLVRPSSTRGASRASGSG